jgi:hypothetical protein
MSGPASMSSPGTWVQVATAAPDCQRWQHGAASWRHVSDGGFDAAAHQVVPIAEDTARRFVATHHYAGSWPAAVHRYGLIHRDELVGAAVFGVPMSVGVLTGPLPTLAPYRQSVELARMVLLDQVPGNGESWMLARAFQDLRRQGVLGVVTFADPLARVDDGGQLVKRGHIGTIYQAGNAAYCGRATPRTLTVLPDGSVLPARAAQKVRAGERGSDGVRRRLIALGADPSPDPDGARWLDRALHQIGAGSVRHPGNHRYVYRLARGIPLGLPTEPYPKDPAPTARRVSPAAPPATPTPALPATRAGAHRGGLAR